MWEFYFIKTNGSLVRLHKDTDVCDRWCLEFQCWQEESLSFLHEMITLGCVMELQPPFRGGATEDILSESNAENQALTR